MVIEVFSIPELNVVVWTIFFHINMQVAGAAGFLFFGIVHIKYLFMHFIQFFVLIFLNLR